MVRACAPLEDERGADVEDADVRRVGAGGRELCGCVCCCCAGGWSGGGVDLVLMSGLKSDPAGSSKWVRFASPIPPLAALALGSPDVGGTDVKMGAGMDACRAGGWAGRTLGGRIGGVRPWPSGRGGMTISVAPPDDDDCIICGAAVYAWPPAARDGGRMGGRVLA
jgi:hypothetical protein